MLTFISDRRLAIGLRGNAAVGLDLFNEEVFIEHIKTTNATIVATDHDIAKWVDSTKAAISARVKDGSMAGCSAGVKVSLCMTAGENKVNDFINATWVPFVNRWNGFLASAKSNPVSNDENVLFNYDKELTSLRATYLSLTSPTALPTVTPPTPEPSAPTLGIGATGASSVATLERLIWLGGILVVGYFAFTYVLPLFLTAGATARAAKRKYEAA